MTGFQDQWEGPSEVCLDGGPEVAQDEEYIIMAISVFKQASTRENRVFPFSCSHLLSYVMIILKVSIIKP